MWQDVFCNPYLELVTPRVIHIHIFGQMFGQILDQGLGIRNYSVQFHRDGFSEIIYPGGESGGKGRSPLPPGTDRTDPNRTYEDLTRARVRVLLSVRGVVY